MAGLWDDSVIGARVGPLQYFGLAKNKRRVAFSIENQRRDPRPVQRGTIKLSKRGDDLDDLLRFDHSDSIRNKLDASFSLSRPTTISEALIDQMGKPAEF